LPLFLLLIAVIDVIADVDAPRTRLCYSASSMPPATDALEIPLLLASDLVAADVELDQRPNVDSISCSILLLMSTIDDGCADNISWLHSQRC
jgi:hypothetical protein